MNKLLTVSVIGIFIIQAVDFAFFRIDDMRSDRDLRDQVTVQDTRVDTYDDNPVLNITLNNKSDTTLKDVDLLISAVNSNGVAVHYTEQNIYSAVPTGLYHVASSPLSATGASNYTYKVSVIKASVGY